jgi:geranylgeranyl reductase family protein
MPDAQIIVVGGGPAGSSTAYFLARMGIDVLLVDKARFPRDKTCSEYLSPQASKILEQMGVLEKVEQSGAAQLAGMRVHSPDGSTIHGEFIGTHGFRGHRDRGLAVRRTILDAILLKQARMAGVRVQERTRVVDVAKDSTGRVTGVITSTEGRTQEIHSMMVVGADGLRSVVGRRLGLIRRAGWPRRIALVAHFRGVAGVPDFGEMYVDRDGYCGLAPVGNGLTNVAVVVPVSKATEVAVDRTEFLESWIAERPQIASMFEHATRVGPVRATGPFATSARRGWARGAALVGDAADFFDPFTGEGIYSALRGGEMLAGYLTEATNARTPEARDASLKQYEAARRSEFSGKWRVEKMIGTAVAFPPLINRAARVLSVRRDMADLLVGVVGDFVPPRQVLRAGYLLSLLLARPDRG